MWSRNGGVSIGDLGDIYRPKERCRRTGRLRNIGFGSRSLWDLRGRSFFPEARLADSDSWRRGGARFQEVGEESASGGAAHQVRSHAVSGTVAVIQTFGPEELARKGIEREAAGPLGEDGRVQGDDAFEHQGVGFALHGRGFSEMQCAGRVGGSVQVLGARVAEVDGFGIDDGAVAAFWAVVNHRSVRSCRGDGVEREAYKMFVFSKRYQY